MDIESRFDYGEAMTMATLIEKLKDEAEAKLVELLEIVAKLNLVD